MNRKQIVIMTVIMVIVSGVAFFGGMKYQESRRPAAFGRFAGTQGQNGQRGGIGGANGRGLRPVNGEVISSDEKSIIVKLQDGSTKIVVLSDSTIINKTTEGSKSDVTAGAKVAVFGTDNSDGSVTAQNIQLNPQFRIGQASPSGSAK